MVFRKDSKVDAFQRQISALRQQLGDGEAVRPEVADEGAPASGFEPVAYSSRESPRSEPYFQGPDTYAPVDSNPPPFQSAPLDDQTSVVAHDTLWNGDLQSNGTVHVHGRVEGSLTAKHDVFVADEAEVSANISADNVSVAGLVRGTVRCANRFEVLPQGRVGGDVFAPILVVHEGATINGQFKMTGTESIGPAVDGGAAVRRRVARSGS